MDERVGSAALPMAVRLRGAAERLRFRRAMTLLAMTMLVPGSAQLVAGNRRIGRYAVRGWICLLGLVVLTGVVGWLDHRVFLVVLTDPRVLAGTRWLLMLVALAWVVLLLDAWRLGDPPTLAQRRRLVVAAASTALVGLVSSLLFFSAHVVAVQRDFIVSVFGSGAAEDAAEGRYNVLLLGGDSSASRWGLRPDSITLASIDEDSGRTVLFGLPRNLANVPFPEGTPMQAEFPEGFDCEGCYLNGVYTYALDHPELFPGAADPGLAATTQAVEAITGLQVHYHALVNMAGFRSLVDAVGGVTIDVRTPIAIGGVGGAVTGTIEAGRQHLDGFETLWFARSRAFDDDYSRMARQKCVLSAMLHQLSPQRVLLHTQEIAEAGKDLFSTDIPATELDVFAALALRARTLPLTTVSFVPPLVNTTDPDWDLIRQRVDEAIAKSESATGQAGGEGRAKGGSGLSRPTKAANHTENLARAC